ncbi:DUF5682 family protein [Embleya sp. NPDC005575]|uniref:vWA domain-containing protein n=1 Tax=Embleya sp. NPDC005575 TaxID=3156892 RepID=UPI0033B1FEC0
MSITRTDGPIDEARPAAARLAASRQPYLIGVRHHAPSLAAAVPTLLDAARPDVLLVELPHEAAPWLEWLAHEDTRAPIALAGTGPGGLGFYPFADFSPELAALRWAARNGVPAIPCDLPLGHPGWDRSDHAPEGDGEGAAGAGGLHAALRDRLTGRAGDDLWDRLVEATAPGSAAEAIRRAALTVGWALRRDAGTVDPVDLRREAWMRATLHEATAAGARAAVVLGAFHAPALLDRDTTAPAAEIADVTMSLIPYTYPLLDARSGYPAGIRDPEWQQCVLESGGDPAALREALIAAAVRICTDLRGQGHPSGPADAREIVRLAGDLANLRGLPAAGRGELLEAVQTVLTHGEPLGRGRSVARALERVLVGKRAGRPAPAAPRSGLGPEVERRIAELGLPGPADPAERDLRLDPLRSDLDRRRELLLQQLTTCRIPYAEPVAVVGAGGADAVTTRWRVRWTPSAAALLDAAGIRGVTPEQAAEGTLRAQHRAELDEGGPTAEQILTGLERAAACGLTELTATRLSETGTTLPTIATLPNLLTALTLTDRIRAGHLGVAPQTTPAPGTPAPATPEASAPDPVASDPKSATPAGTAVAAPDPKSATSPGAGVVAPESPAPDPAAPDPKSATSPGVGEDVTQTLLTAAVRHLDGLTGSDDPADARALADLAERADTFGGIRLSSGLARLAADGSPLMSAAAGAVRVLLGHEDAAGLGDRIGSWIDTATTPAARADLTRRFTGLLTAAGPLLQIGGPVLAALLNRVDTLADRPFLDRLPALRGGFDTLSPAARDRVLDAVADHLGDRVDTDADPIDLARWTTADLTAREALTHRGLLPAPNPAAVTPGTNTAPDPEAEPAPEIAHAPETAPLGGPRGLIGSPDAVIPQPADPAQIPADQTPTAAPLPTHDLPGALRWKLILGRRSDRLQGNAGKMATALDELYGTGRGEGSRSDLGGGAGGGREAPYPGVREWSEELIALFGSDIREEVLAAAAAAGRTDVLTHLDPAAARPSVDLLKTVLAHAGGLPEAKLALLRPLIARIVAELTRELATRLRPALTGITTPRPTRRPGGALDLPRTLRANLTTARRTANGTVVVVPERPIFRTRSSRSNDWRLILVVDVSGSMEASTIWSALTASILAGVPSLSTHFLAFSTEVIDLTEHVHDPLGLLLEVKVGGGTHIAAGLRAARELVTVPSRTLITVISDFEEGYPLGGLLGEVRTLASSGCHILGCASLDDAGRPRYSAAVAGSLVAAGMPVAALSPTELARWVGEKVR